MTDFDPLVCSDSKGGKTNYSNFLFKIITNMFHGREFIIKTISHEYNFKAVFAFEDVVLLSTLYELCIFCLNFDQNMTNSRLFDFLTIPMKSNFLT